jgi:hypothetical protein
MNNKHLFALILTLALGALALSCADSESRMPVGGATAIIKLGHSDAIAKAISPGAPLEGKEAATLPAAIDRVQVRVSGADIGTIEKNVPYSDTISIDVPPGAVRRFEVTAFVSPTDPSAASTFKGISTANVPAGATVAVPVMMILDETKFVLPDYINQRVVQFNTLADADTTWLTGSSGSFSISNFNPLDVDFDARGRIFILNNDPSTTPADNIYRCENINSPAIPVLNPADYDGPPMNITAMAVDKRRNLLYFTDDSYGIVLYQADLGALPVTTSVQLYNPLVEGVRCFNSITAMDVGDDGMLSIIGTNGNDEPVLVKYNPLVVEHMGEVTRYGAPVGTPFNFTSLNITPRDVQVRDQDVSVLTNPGDSGAFALVQFQTMPSGFILGQHFGSLAFGALPQPGIFYGPQKFAIRRENLMVVIDEGSYYSGWNHGVDRLVLTDFDIAKPWTTFGKTGTGIGQFNFYAYC